MSLVCFYLRGSEVESAEDIYKRLTPKAYRKPKAKAEAKETKPATKATPKTPPKAEA
jgi:hypothetical protein